MVKGFEVCHAYQRSKLCNKLQSCGFTTGTVLFVFPGAHEGNLLSVKTFSWSVAK